MFSMTNPEFPTLAYNKSPKTTRRTTFQDELQAAVSARANKTKSSQYSYYDGFEEDDDDFLHELLKSTRRRTDALKAVKSKARSSTFELSDDEGKESRIKKVSFLKTQRSSSSSKDTTASESQNRPDSSDGGHAYYNDSFASTTFSEDNPQFDSADKKSPDPQTIQKDLSASLSYQTSDDTLLDLPLPPLPSDGSVVETPGPDEKSNPSQTPQLPTTGLNQTASTGDGAEREPPKPKPRQRTFGINVQAAAKPPEETEFQDHSRPQTSSASIPLSNDTFSNTALRSCSPQWADGDRPVSYGLSKSSSSKSGQSQLLNKSTEDSGSKDGFLSDDSKEQERNCFASLDELNEPSRDHSDLLSSVPEKSFDSNASGSPSQTTRRSQSVCSSKVESKYLGSLKVLDRKVSLQESEPPAADSLRAAIYQEWLKKKKEMSRENLQLKKKEEIQRETKKKEKDVKQRDAIVSYEAWKNKKAEILRAKAKERQELIQKEQRATEEKEEKSQSAKQVFEQWKREHDHLLKEKYRKAKEAENKLKKKKQEKEEQRKQESNSAFSNWSEKKKSVLHEKHATARKEVKNKVEEERYIKEERDKMALEVYESWLTRKELEQKRQREERRIQTILRDSPPPPWSPPNKTIPFRK